MDVTIVQFLVKNQEQIVIVNQGGYLFLIRPGRLIKVMITNLWKGILVHVLDVKQDAVFHSLAKVEQEIFHIFRHAIVVIAFIGQIQLWISSMGVLIIVFLQIQKNAHTNECHMLGYVYGKNNFLQT